METFRFVRCLLRLVAQSRTRGIYLSKLGSFYISAGKPKRTILMKPRMFCQKLGENKNPQVVWRRPRDFVIVYIEPIEAGLYIEVLNINRHIDECKITTSCTHIQAFIHSLTNKTQRKLITIWYQITYNTFLILKRYKYQRKLPKNLCYKKVIIIFAVVK